VWYRHLAASKDVAIWLHGRDVGAMSGNDSRCDTMESTVMVRSDGLAVVHSASSSANVALHQPAGAGVTRLTTRSVAKMSPRAAPTVAHSDAHVHCGT